MENGTLILIVEDDGDLATVLGEVLGSRGYRVQLAPTGEAALIALAVEPPALVILDWGIPDADPEELGQVFKGRGIPVVLASGSECTDELAMRVEARAVLDKPYHIDDVFAVVERLLGTQALRYS